VGSLKEDSAEESEAGQELYANDQQDDKDGHQVSVQAREAISSTASDITAVDEVEDLQEDEGVPDQSEVLHLCLSKAEDILINGLGRGEVIKLKDTLAGIHDDHHDGDHEEGDSKDLAVHGRGEDLAGVVVSLGLLAGTC